MDGIDPLHGGDGLRAVQATEEERAAIRARLSKRAESAPAAARVGRASALAWAGLRLAAIVLLAAGVGIGLGDGDEFDDVGCTVAQQPGGTSHGARSARAGERAGGTLPGSDGGSAGSSGNGEVGGRPECEVRAAMCAHRMADGLCQRLGRQCRLFGGAGAEEAGQAAPLGSPPSEQPRYALRRDGGLWHLTFEGREAFLKHEQGIYYVAEMLGQPGERVKKLNLATKYSSPKSKHRSSMEVYDPATGKYDIPASTEPVHEAALAADDDEARNAYKQRARELLETIDDPTETERAKEEAREELGEITAHLSQESRQLRDPTKGAGDAVRNAINRLLHSLAAPGGSAASPPSVRRGFAEHLQQYLIIPSRRYAAPGARKDRGDLTGCLLYDPPAGTFWAVGQ